MKPHFNSRSGSVLVLCLLLSISVFTFIDVALQQYNEYLQNMDNLKKVDHLLELETHAIRLINEVYPSCPNNTTHLGSSIQFQCTDVSIKIIFNDTIETLYSYDIISE